MKFARSTVWAGEGVTVVETCDKCGGELEKVAPGEWYCFECDQTYVYDIDDEDEDDDK